MKGKKYTILVILYTFFNVGILIGASDYIQQAYRSEYNNKKQVNSQINYEISNDEIDGESINLENVNKNGEVAQNKSENETSINESNKSYGETTYENDEKITKEPTNYVRRNSAKSNINSQQSTKVFKATAEEIISDLDTIEKAKILWVCRKLTKAEYNEIKEYLSYNNEKLGVMKVYEILDDKLDDKSLEEVKEIFSKYIDTEKVKEIY